METPCIVARQRTLWLAVTLRPIFSELRTTLALAFPIIVGQLSQMLMGVADSVMVGRLGAVPLAAAAFANVLFMGGFMLGGGVLASGSVLISRTHGAKQSRKCAEYLRHGVWLAAGLGVLICAGILSLIPWLDHFGQPLEVLAAVRPYLELIAVSLLPTLLFQVLRQFGEATGHPWGPMVILLSSVALNVLLNWILIYGHWGAPALGLAGAGWATLASRIVSLFALWAWLRVHKELRAEWPGTAAAKSSVHVAEANPAWFSRLSWTHLREMFVLGIPIAGQFVFEGGFFAISALMMGWIGTVPLAAHQIAINCAGFAWVIPLGLSIALSVRVGRTVGEGRVELLPRIVFGAQGAGLAYAVFSILTFVFAGRAIAAGFTPEVRVVELAAQLLIIAALFQVFDGGQVIASGALRGLADVKVPSVITFISYWVIGLPLAYFLGVRLAQPQAVWSSMVVGLALGGMMLWRRLYVQIRRTAKRS